MHQTLVIAIFALLLCSFCIKPSHQQSSISLNNAQWFVSNSNGSLVLPAQVPGGIYSDLRRNQVLKQDLLYGRNDLAYRWVGSENWTYTASFAIDQQIAMSQSVKLVFHGLDTISTVYLNGEEIGTTDNMFVRYKFDVKPYLKLAGLKNVLVVKFESPIKYAAKKSHQSIRQNRGKIIPPYCPSPAQRGECHVNMIRKMQASFSWDWGPAFPSVGIYKSVDIEYGSFGIIRDILVETRRLPPLVQPQRQPPHPPPQVIISSTIKHNVRVPTINNTKVPYMRAPPYYVSPRDEADPLMIEQPTRIDLAIPSQQQLMEENWLLKITLVAEMVQPSFGYNVRVEFNLNGMLHYESEHINVVANSEGFIRLGFNLRIDTSRMQVKPWWPNNAGSQTLYLLSARMMPVPAAPDRVRLHAAAAALASSDPMARTSSMQSPVSLTANAERQPSLPLQARAKPLQTPAVPPTVFLATPPDMSSYLAQQLSEKEIWFGFRTVELIQEPITTGNLDDGLTFNFRINGVDLFAMGSNWIPSSILPENSNDLEHIRYLLQSAKDANMNMLRVWGGGIYESDEFYRLADELGIMIWHDFMFACALYPVEEDFIASVRLEVEQQVQRLQYHPSIVLWAGNNENEMAIAGPWWPEVLLWNKKLRENYAKLYVETIKPIVQILDPTRPYVESSPSNGIVNSFDWTVFPSTRFASEYGYQSYPSFNALTSVTLPTDWKYPLTSNILHRQHRITGETEIKLQIKAHFNDVKSGGVDKFKNFLYLSQLTQAVAIKTETEFYRRNRFIDPETKLGKTMGALYWQLNDVWPAPTWSSIEFGGKWKMLHYFARRFFFPIQVMPYLIQPSSTSSISSALQQVISSGSTILTNLSNRLPGSSPSVLQSFMSGSTGLSAGAEQLWSQQSQQQTQQQQPPLPPQPSGGPLFVVDLVRDDAFHLLDSFNVTIRFYRWTSFVPVWQDTVYVRHTRPQNVTRIYEQDVMRITRQPGVVSLSSGVFQVLVEQQPRLGLSVIENYLMPVAPNRVTAMRVARINVELIQGPFELSEAGSSRQHSRRSSSGAQTPFGQSASLLGNAQSQWACAYRLTLVSDSIAMFVWLDLNVLNLQTASSHINTNEGPPSQHQSTAFQRGPSAVMPNNIHLDALPSIGSGQSNNHAAPSLPPHHMPPEHIRLHLNQHGKPQVPDGGGSGGIGDLNQAMASEVFETLASESKIDVGEGSGASESGSVKEDLASRDHTPTTLVEGETASGPAAAPSGVSELGHDFTSDSSSSTGFNKDDMLAGAGQTSNHQREKRQLDQLPPERIVLNINNNAANNADGNQRNPEPQPPAVTNNKNHPPGPIPSQAQQQHQPLKPRQQIQPAYKPVDASGSNMLRYQFSDNAFNMFEPSRVIDLYLSRCLSKAQVEVALEVQSMADSL